MIRALKRLYNIPAVKATLERMWRGGAVAVGAAYVAGSLVLSDMTFDSGLDLARQVVTIFAIGAAGSLLLALGIQVKTKTGPALNKAEQITKEN